MATFRKRRSRKYRNKNTRRKYHKARKSRSRKSLEGGVITDADQPWGELQEKQATDEKAAAKEAAAADKKEIEDEQVNDVTDASNMSEDDAIEVEQLMNKGYNREFAINLHRNNKEITQIYEKLVRLEKAKKAEAKKHRLYRWFFGGPAEPRVTERTGNDYENFGNEYMRNYYLRD